MALHGSLASREPLVSTSCPPVHVMTHVFSSARCFTYCWSLAPLPPSARCAWEVAQTSVALPVHVHVAILLWSALAEGCVWM